MHVFPPTCYRCPFGKNYPECGITCATIINDVIEMEDPATVAAKAALLSGPEAAPDWLHHGGVLVLDDGTHRVYDPG